MANQNDDSSAQIDNRWLAYELHDGLLQWVISARMHVEAALSTMAPGETGPFQKLQATQLFLTSALEEGRELIGFLEGQSALPAVDAVAAIRDFSDRLQSIAAAQKQTIEAAQPEVPWPNLPPRVAWNLLRIAQQAVLNAMQHAGPCDIQIECKWRTSNTLRLTIRDNGQGFDSKSAQEVPNHFGIASMQHRANLVGASLEIDSQAGRGTSVQIEIPAALH